MKPVVVSAHNPMSGPRHLGHYMSTMMDWPRLQADHELFIVIDDLIAIILYPRARGDIQRRAFQTAKECIATGIDLNENHIVLTSMLPEVHELALFTALAMDYQWCDTLYVESFVGLLNSYQRRELHLPRQPSVAEVIYPQLHLATLTLGLRADFFQGGEEMRGYMHIMEALVEQLGLSVSLTVPSLLTTNYTFCPGTDGRHMAAENAVYVSASEQEIAQGVSNVQSLDVLRYWEHALHQGDAAASTGNGSERGAVSDEHIKRMTDTLHAELRKFRECNTSNQDIADVLTQSAVVARERIKNTLIEVKGAFGVPGFVHATTEHAALERSV